MPGDAPLGPRGPALLGVPLTSTWIPVISPAELHWEDGGVLSLWSLPGSYHDRQEDW